MDFEKNIKNITSFTTEQLNNLGDDDLINILKNTHDRFHEDGMEKYINIYKTFAIMLVVDCFWWKNKLCDHLKNKENITPNWFDYFQRKNYLSKHQKNPNNIKQMTDRSRFVVNALYKNENCPWTNLEQFN